MIELLPYLIKISESLLKKSANYQNYANEIRNYVHCGYKNQDVEKNED